MQLKPLNPHSKPDTWWLQFTESSSHQDANSIAEADVCNETMRARSARALGASALLLAVVVAVACSGDSPSAPGGGTPAADSLAAAQSRWNSRKPAGNRYVMVQRVVCFCVAANVEYRVTVQGTSVTAAVNNRTDAPLPAAQWIVFRTVDQLFELVRTAQRAAGTLKAVEYDATMGFPRTLSLDPVLSAIDDEVAYVTTSVTAVP